MDLLALMVVAEQVLGTIQVVVNQMVVEAEQLQLPKSLVQLQPSDMIHL